MLSKRASSNRIQERPSLLSVGAETQVADIPVEADQAEDQIQEVQSLAEVRQVDRPEPLGSQRA